MAGLKRGRRSERKENAVKELKDSIEKYGKEGGVKIVRELYPDVPRATWKDWVDTASAGPMDIAVEKAMKAAKHLPVAPPPEYILEKPVEARQGIDFMARLEHLYADAELLRAWSMSSVTTADGKTSEKIKVPTFFSQSIKLRSDLLETAVRTIQQFYDLRRMQRFYDTILEEISAESPEVALRITERLAKLDAESGMTIDARL